MFKHAYDTSLIVPENILFAWNWTTRNKKCANEERVFFIDHVRTDFIFNWNPTDGIQCVVRIKLIGSLYPRGFYICMSAELVRRIDAFHKGA